MANKIWKSNRIKTKLHEALVVVIIIYINNILLKLININKIIKFFIKIIKILLKFLLIKCLYPICCTCRLLLHRSERWTC